MFEHVQQRNRRPVFVPILIGVGICIAVYFVVQRWSRRSSEREMNEMFSTAIPALSSPTVADDVPLERVALPGMSIELAGRTIHRGDYVAGNVEVAGSVSVGWTPGLLPKDVAFMQQQFKIFGAGVQPPTETQLGGAFAYEEHADARLHVLAGTCGRRTVIIQGQVSRPRFDQIKASFRCAPDRELLHLGVIVGPHKGWKRVDDDPKIKLVGSDGETRMTLQSRKSSYDPRGELSIPADAKPEVFGIYRVWRGKGTALDGTTPLVTALVDWQCPDHPYFGEAFMTSPTSVDEGIKLALTGSCIAMTAPLPPHLQL